MKVVLDFDDTIFNTGAFIEEKIKIFNKLGFSREEYFVNYDKILALKGYFDSDSMIDLFLKSKKFDKKRVKSEVEAVIKRSKIFIYEDFFDFTADFDRKDLILVSVGSKAVQMGKIDNSDVIPFFSKVKIAEKYKSDEIVSVYKKHQSEKVFFIDDKAMQIDEAKKRLPKIVAIKMERPGGKHILPKSELADYIVKDLIKAKKIINELK